MQNGQNKENMTITRQFLAKQLWRYRAAKPKEIVKRLLEFECIRRNYSKLSLMNMATAIRSYEKDPQPKLTKKLISGIYRDTIEQLRQGNTNLNEVLSVAAAEGLCKPDELVNIKPEEETTADKITTSEEKETIADQIATLEKMKEHLADIVQEENEQLNKKLAEMYTEVHRIQEIVQQKREAAANKIEEINKEISTLVTRELMDEVSKRM